MNQHVADEYPRPEGSRPTSDDVAGAVLPAATVDVTDAVRHDGAGMSADTSTTVVETVLSSIAELRPDPKNRRRHNARNIDLIVDAIHEVGTGRSVVIDESGQVLAGNATVHAAAKAGIQHVRVIEATGNEIIAVRRRGLTEDQKRYLALADNRAGELATWDLTQLQADADAGLDLGSFFEPVELADLLRDGAPVPDFQPEEQRTQGRLDQLDSKTTCPKCGHAF